MNINCPTKESLKNAVRDACNSFTQETIRKIINQFPCRCRKIVESRGGNYRFIDTEYKENLK